MSGLRDVLALIGLGLRRQLRGALPWTLAAAALALRALAPDADDALAAAESAGVDRELALGARAANLLVPALAAVGLAWLARCARILRAERTRERAGLGATPVGTLHRDVAGWSAAWLAALICLPVLFLAVGSPTSWPAAVRVPSEVRGAASALLGDAETLELAVHAARGERLAVVVRRLNDGGSVPSVHLTLAVAGAEGLFTEHTASVPGARRVELALPADPRDVVLRCVRVAGDAGVVLDLDATTAVRTAGTTSLLGLGVWLAALASLAVGVLLFAVRGMGAGYASGLAAVVVLLADGMRDDSWTSELRGGLLPAGPEPGPALLVFAGGFALVLAANRGGWRRAR